MTGFTLRLPYRDRSEPLDAAAIADLPRAISDPEERVVARAVLMSARANGLDTIGEVLDSVENGTLEERRSLVDGARASIGFPTVTELERAQEKARAVRWPPPAPAVGLRDANGKAIQSCAHPGCEAVSSSPEGALVPVADRRWRCLTHRPDGPPGDSEPFDEPDVYLDERGHPKMRPEAEAHYEREYRKAEEAGRRAAVDQEAERKRIAKLERQYRESLEPPPGFRPFHHSPGGDG